ncbi:O-antigen ligase family protein [Saccharicrinis sp. FJH54]|uniref:O-antigen ligase family protein n=1 Tax=Saccharicrinis sp. FJH54 TaxID=3344665 RepID=UPI0035D4DC41
MALLIAISVITFISQVSWILPGVGFAYYMVFLAIALMLIPNSTEYRVHPLMLWFVLAALSSILFNNIPPFFRAKQRYVSFIIMLLLLSPLIQSVMLNYYRQQLFKVLSQTIIIMVAISFLGVVTGLGLMKNWTGIIGLFSHSMMLGPLASIAMILAASKALQGNHSKKQQYYIYWFLTGASLITAIAAGSRSALMGGIVGLLFMIFKINQNRLSRFFKIIIILVVLAFSSFPLWEQYTEKMMSKMESAEREGDLTSSRAALWQTRIYEFDSSPFIGVGFASMNIRLTGSYFNKDNGNIEPGSSWLAILSMMGLAGFIPLLLLLSYALFMLYTEKKDLHEAALHGALLLFFIAHMMAEGYLHAAGNGLFFYFWLLIGNTIQLKTKEASHNFVNFRLISDFSTKHYSSSKPMQTLLKQ